MRLSEAFVLTWDDVEFDNNIIDINKQVHKNIEKTLQIYAHVTPKMQDNTIKLLESLKNLPTNENTGGQMVDKVAD